MEIYTWKHGMIFWKKNKNKNNELSGGFSCPDFQHMTVGIVQTWRIAFAPVARPPFVVGIWQSLAKSQMISENIPTNPHSIGMYWIFP